MLRVKNNLKDILKTNEMSQSELGRQVGATPQQVGHWVRNTYNPTKAYYEKIFDVLSTSFEEVFFISENAD